MHLYLSNYTCTYLYIGTCTHIIYIYLISIYLSIYICRYIYMRTSISASARSSTSSLSRATQTCTRGSK